MEPSSTLMWNRVPATAVPVGWQFSDFTPKSQGGCVFLCVRCGCPVGPPSLEAPSEGRNNKPLLCLIKPSLSMYQSFCSKQSTR